MATATRTKPRSNGLIVPLLVLLLLLLLITTTPGTPPENLPPTPCPNVMTPEQEANIRDFAQKLGPGGAFEGYPMLGDLATRTAFLAKRGIVGIDAIFKFSMNAGTVRQTAYELARGSCWSVSDPEILNILKFFVELAKAGKL